MRNFYSKLLVLSFIIITTAYYNVLDLKYLLIFFSISILNEFLDSKFKNIISIFLICFLFFSENLFFYTPLFIYDINTKNNYIIFLLNLFFLKKNLLTFITNILSIFLNNINKKYLKLLNENISITDHLREDALLLKSINKNLELDYNKNLELAILEERNRISRQLHDSIGHLFSSSIVQLEAIKIINSDVNINSNLTNLENTLKTGMMDVRNNIHNIYNESFDLKEEINKILDTVDDNIFIDFFFRFECNNIQLKHDILSIIKEAINNINKHSNTDEIKINLLTHKNFHKVSITDNGSMYNPNEGGIGLLSIKQIVQKYNGVFNYTFDDGFKVHITLIRKDD